MSIKLKDTIYDLINNADKLGGSHLTDIIRYYAPSSSSALNLDDLKATTGFQVTGWAYAGSSYVNSQPDGDGASSAATVIKFPGNYPFQIYRFYSSNDIKVRGYYSGTGWTSWATILTSDNYTTYCAPESHSHNYASTVKVGSTSYSCSSNVISLPAYPTIPTSLKCPTSLTIQFNGTSQGVWDGSTAKTINITPAAIGAADASHNHSNHLSLAAYSFSSGCLVKTDIPTASNTMITFRIEGNSYGSKTILTTGHFYNYNDNNQILSADATNHGYGFGDISVFCYSNNVYLWFKQQSNYQSFIVYVYSSNYGTSGLNRAVSISNSAIPSSGVTRKVVITPKTSLDSSNWSSYCAPASHTHSYLPLSGGTLSGNIYFGSDSTSYNQTGTSSIFPAHFYRNCWDASGNVYDHYYNPAYTASTNTTANLRVKSSGGFKVLTFSGSGGFTWDGNTVITSGNWSSYCAAKSHTHDYAASSHTHTKSQITDFSHTHNYAGSNSAGGAANLVNSHDTRSVTIAPDSYGPTLSCHFKQNGTNGVNDGGNYFGLIHFRPYGSNTDFTGGYPHQLAFTENNNIWYRKATSSTAWGAWKKIWHSGIFEPGNYMPKSGGTFTGSVTFANGTWNVVGDDAAIGDYNAAGMLGLKSCNNNIPGIGFHNSAGTLLGRLQSNGSTLQWNDQTIIHSGNIGSQSVNYANYAAYLPTLYIGGQQTNPQTYFNNGIGVRVAMTGMSSKGTSYWSDTLWINGYSGGDVPNMCALHFNRDGSPRAFISTQSNQSSSYGTFYEFITGYNIGSQSVNYANSAGSVAWGNVSGKPSSFNPSSHTHDYAASNHGHTYYWANVAVSTSTSTTTSPTFGTVSIYATGTGLSCHTSGTYSVAAHFQNASCTSTLDSYATVKAVTSGASYVGFYTNGKCRYASASSTSDRRLKKDIKYLTEYNDEYIKRMDNIDFVSFRYNDSKDENSFLYGFIAQDVQKYFPEIVDDNGEYLCLDYNSCLVLKIASLERKIKMLEKKLADISILA